MKIKFISYTGEYPHLCRGILKIEVDGKLYELKDVLQTTGYISSDNYWDYYIYKGRWQVLNLPEELIPYKKQIERIVNRNVEKGCCGGCI